MIVQIFEKFRRSFLRDLAIFFAQRNAARPSRIAAAKAKSTLNFVLARCRELLPLSRRVRSPRCIVRALLLPPTVPLSRYPPRTMVPSRSLNVFRT